MRTLVQRLKRLWNTPVEFYGVDRPEPQAGPWHGLMLFVVLLVVLGLLWLIRYLPERTYLVQLPPIFSWKADIFQCLEHDPVPIPALASFFLDLFSRHLPPG